MDANEDLGSSACVVMMFFLIEECGRYKYCKCQLDFVEICRKRRVRMEVKTSSMAWWREANLLTASTKTAIVELGQARLRRLTTKESIHSRDSRRQRVWICSVAVDSRNVVVVVKTAVKGR